MVFGALLGGIAERAGERFHENTLRQRKIEDWQRQEHLNFLIDRAKDWDNYDAGQQMALGSQIGEAVGAKPKDVEQWITAAKAIHSMIPQIQAVPEALGPVQRGGTVTAVPSPEAPMRGISAPATPQFSDLPTPGATLSPAIMAPSTGGTASFGRDMTPNQMKAQQAADQAAALRKQRISEIRLSGMPQRYQDMAEANAYGLNVIPYESAGVRADTQRQIAKDKEDDVKNVAFHVVRGGQQYPVYNTALGAMWDDPATGARTPYKVQPGDKRLERPIPLGQATGAKDVFTYSRDPNAPAPPTPLGIGIKPTASGSGSAASSRDFRDEMALRKDFENHPITKQADETARQVRLATSAMASGSPNFVAIDQALINVFNKMIDPNSVVREGEYARTIDNTPLLNRIKGKMAAIQAGGAGLTTEERNELVAISKRFAADSQAALGARAEEFKRMARERKWNPNNVVVPRLGDKAAGGGTAVSDVDYGPVENATIDGKPARVRKNLKTGKYRRVD